MQSAHCALPSDRQPKLQPAIVTFSAGEFRRQPALSDNTGIINMLKQFLSFGQSPEPALPLRKL